MLFTIDTEERAIIYEDVATLQDFRDFFGDNPIFLNYRLIQGSAIELPFSNQDDQIL